MDDSSDFWKKYKNFSENRLPKSTFDDNISPSEWKNHFENLHTEKRDQTIPNFVEKQPSKSLNKIFKMKELENVIKK